jgi:PAS domain S-box-containing protein
MRKMEYNDNNTSNGTSKDINKGNIAIREYNQELNKIRSILVGSSKGYTVTEISRKIKINRNSVAKYLDILVTAGVAEMKMVGSAKLFTLSKRMSISSVMNISSDYILLLDEDSHVTYANENMLTFEGKTLEEIIGKHVEILEFVRHAGNNISALLHESFLGKEVSADLEFAVNNTTHSFRTKFVPGILENSKKGLIIIMSKKDDVRHLPQNTKEQNLFSAGMKNPDPPSGNDAVARTPFSMNAADDPQGKKFWDYLEDAPEGIWAVDENMKTTFLNRRMAEMLGYTVEETLGHSLFTFLDESCVDHTKKTFELPRKDRTIRRKNRVRFVRKDKTKIDTTIASTPFFNESGIFTGALTIISDITEWNKAEKARRENEEYFRAIIAASPNGMIQFDGTGQIRMANRQTVRYFGYTEAKELENENIFNFISPDDFKKCHNFLKNLVSDEDATSIECSFIKKDSTEFRADLTLSLFGGVSRKENLFIGVITDVTERRKAEASIKKSAQMYRSLVEGISHIIFTLDLKGKITYISPVIQHILGYLPEDLNGKHFYVIAPSDARQTIAMKLEEAQRGISAPFDIQVKDKAGDLRWVRIIAGARKEDGKVSGFTGLIGDINKWKLTENAIVQCELKFKAVVEDQTDLICRFASNFEILFVNPAFCRFFDQKEEEILKKKVIDFISPHGQSSLRDAIAQLDMDHKVRILELDFATASGLQYSYHITVHGIFNALGEKIEYQIICRDITELKTYFERTQKLLQDLQRHEAEVNLQNEELKRLQNVAELSERRSREWCNVVPVGNLILDPAGKIIDVNPTGAQLIGEKKDLLILRSFVSFIAQDCLKKFSRFLKNVFASQKRQICEITLSPRGNSPFPGLLVGEMIEGPPGKPEQCSVVLIALFAPGTADQTPGVPEIAKTDLTGDAMIRCTIEGIITDWNPDAERVFGYTVEDITGRHISLLVPPGNPHELSLLLEGTFKGETVDPYEVSSLKKDGSIIKVILSASPVRDTTGRITGALIRVRENGRKGAEKTRHLGNTSPFINQSPVMTR